MSKLSQMYGYWKDSIKTSMKRYDENLEKSLTHLQDFYNTVLKDYIIDWSKYFENQAFRHSLRKKIESFFGKSEINFVAIDGTCIKDEGSNFITFFAGAYGARGKIIIKHEGEKIKYERWDFARDVTMMAQIPVHRDWEDQEKEPLDDATKIRCLAIPTNIEIIIDNKQSISIGIGSNLPMVGAEAFLLDEELTNRMRYGEIKEFGFSNENVIDQKNLLISSTDQTTKYL